MGLFDKIKNGLAKTRDKISSIFDSVIAEFQEVDEEMLEELEEALILSDLGVETSTEVIDRLRDEVKAGRLKSSEEVKEKLADILADIIKGEPDSDAELRGPLGLRLNTKPSIILIVGVNGVGKTTSIGKLAYLLKNEGKKVLLAAGDTFRAAAAEQLTIWADRAGVDIVKHEEGSDPAAVIFDAISSAKARGSDVIICDTAGRLHNKANLMQELEKISRVIDREMPGADRETLLILDATTGQNALQQAHAFRNTAGITGFVLTKLDGTAKGGVAIAIRQELDVPVRFICVGEGIDDLLPFDPKSYAEALFKER